jgi:hypothetical protein
MCNPTHTSTSKEYNICLLKKCGFLALYLACIEQNGDYVEKLHSFVPLSFNNLN